MMENSSRYDRYQRQVILKNFGERGQQKLLDARVLVVGAGGLGCPALQYLAAAGVGTIGIMDDDIVQVTNLHRQVLYSMQDIGLLKAPTAATALHRLNPSTRFIVFTDRLQAKNALSVMQDFDIIIDGTDNFATRYMINDACVLLNKVLVYGAVSAFEGQVAVFNKKDLAGVAVNYRDLFPVPPAAGEVPNCEEAGVLGVLPGIIGTMQASETIKLLTGIGTTLVNQILTYDSLSNEFFKHRLTPGANTIALMPRTCEAFENWNYADLCAQKMDTINEIDHNFFDELIRSAGVEVIDVREPGELPAIKEFVTRNIPLSTLQQHLEALDKKVIVCICQTGKRSQQAAQTLAGFFGTSRDVYSLQGGILQWKKQHQQ